VRVITIHAVLYVDRLNLGFRTSRKELEVLARSSREALWVSMIASKASGSLGLLLARVRV
jgi:hypothetical protein